MLGWTFDTECICQTGDYVRIVKKLCSLANKPNLINGLKDFVDIEEREAWLKYRINGKHYIWTIEVNDDWADTLTLSYVMDNIESDGFHFYFKDSGQAMILFYLHETDAFQINHCQAMYFNE
ncbi:hypothetical protein F7734_34570 [Scytonema sp. UIC 10036]|uniref:hypothetical protein n=1 Tax=Scytonema sp. UIC 10036 TaxID=2304196 RepID=UPI0012DA6572|nr:hypothetical protein [Scytonema sp. UIC 10036]MUG97183.1 hypothetical protein [Scytonema sp. UIC 10036]